MGSLPERIDSPFHDGCDCLHDGGSVQGSDGIDEAAAPVRCKRDDEVGLAEDWDVGIVRRNDSLRAAFTSKRANPDLS